MKVHLLEHVRKRPWLIQIPAYTIQVPANSNVNSRWCANISPNKQARANLIQDLGDETVGAGFDPFVDRHFGR